MDSTQSDSLTQRMLAFQSQMNALSNEMTQAMSLVSSRPGDAYRLCTQALEKHTVLSEAYEAFLRSIGLPDEQILQTQQMARVEQVQMLSAKGSAALLLNKISEARSLTEQALALLDEQDPMRPMLQLQLASIPLVENGQAAADHSSPAESAAAPYETAFRGFIKQAFEVKLLVVKWANSQGFHAEALDYSNAATALAKHYLPNLVDSQVLLPTPDTENPQTIPKGRKPLGELSVTYPATSKAGQLIISAGAGSEWTDKQGITVTLAGHEAAFQRFVEQAVQARTQQAAQLYQDGHRAEFIEYSKEAIQLAESQGLTRLASDLRSDFYIRRLTTDPDGEVLQAIREDKHLRNPTATDPEAAKALTLAAEYSVANNDYDSALEFLSDAEKYTQALPDKHVFVLFALSNAYEQLGRHDKAVQTAEDALQIARSLQWSMVLAQALRTLILLRLEGQNPEQAAQADREIEELQKTGEVDEYYLVLQTRSLIFTKQGKDSLAIADLEQMESIATTSDNRINAIYAKAGICLNSGQYDEALVAAQRGITLLDKELSADTALSATQWQDRLGLFSHLHDLEAWSLAKLGRAREAFEAIEKGKTASSRRLLSDVDSAQTWADPTELTTLEGMSTWLLNEQVALLAFVPLRVGTLVIAVDAHQPDPLVEFLPFSGTELKNLFPPDQRESLIWKEKLAQILPVLSEKLLHPLENLLQPIFDHSSVLYILPEDNLYLVPFAALTLPDGSYLVEHCAVAYAPSLAVLNGCRSRPSANTEREGLVVGVGYSENISFAEQAKALNVLNWTTTMLLENEATPERFLDQAPSHNILHLACHGTVSVDPDVMLASQLQFADNQLLTAKDVFALNGRLSSTLVFLNACQSGRFHGREVNGFWRAFIHAGARSLVATLVYVDPTSADKLAMAFYKHWFGGNISKAEALRRAQLHLIQQGTKVEDWSSHILIGDFR